MFYDVLVEVVLTFHPVRTRGHSDVRFTVISAWPSRFDKRRSYTSKFLSLAEESDDERKKSSRASRHSDSAHQVRFVLTGYGFFTHQVRNAWFDPQTKKLEPHCITKQTALHESTVQ